MAEISEDVKKQTLEAGRDAKVALEMDVLPVRGADLSDVYRGPTTLPGQNPGYGRNFNPVESMPEPQKDTEPQK